MNKPQERKEVRLSIPYPKTKVNEKLLKIFLSKQKPK
jgi:hypothetical protein